MASFFFTFAQMIEPDNTILLSTAYFPPLSWMMAAASKENVLIEAHETYPRQTYRNRCEIISANGLLSLSVPVKRPKGKGTITKDVLLAYDEPWQRNHLRTLHAAYSNSPFYLYYIDSFMPFFEKKEKYLLDLNLEIFGALCTQLELNIKTELTSGFNKHESDVTDLRSDFSPKKKRSTNKIKPYHQVFEERHGFIADLSILDLLFNEGPMARERLNRE